MISTWEQRTVFSSELDTLLTLINVNTSRSLSVWLGFMLAISHGVFISKFQWSAARKTVMHCEANCYHGLKESILDWKLKGSLTETFWRVSSWYLMRTMTRWLIPWNLLNFWKETNLSARSGDIFSAFAWSWLSYANRYDINNIHNVCGDGCD